MEWDYRFLPLYATVTFYLRIPVIVWLIVRLLLVLMIKSHSMPFVLHHAGSLKTSHSFRIVHVPNSVPIEVKSSSAIDWRSTRLVVLPSNPTADSVRNSAMSNILWSLTSPSGSKKSSMISPNSPTEFPISETTLFDNCWKTWVNFHSKIVWNLSLCHLEIRPRDLTDFLQSVVQIEVDRGGDWLEVVGVLRHIDAVDPDRGREGPTDPDQSADAGEEEGKRPQGQGQRIRIGCKGEGYILKTFLLVWWYLRTPWTLLFGLGANATLGAAEDEWK